MSTFQPRTIHNDNAEFVTGILGLLADMKEKINFKSSVVPADMENEYPNCYGVHMFYTIFGDLQGQTSEVAQLSTGANLVALGVDGPTEPDFNTKVNGTRGVRDANDVLRAGIPPFPALRLEDTDRVIFGEHEYLSLPGAKAEPSAAMWNLLGSDEAVTGWYVDPSEIIHQARKVLAQPLTVESLSTIDQIVTAGYGVVGAVCADISDHGIVPTVDQKVIRKQMLLVELKLEDMIPTSPAFQQLRAAVFTGSDLAVDKQEAQLMASLELEVSIIVRNIIKRAREYVEECAGLETEDLVL